MATDPHHESFFASPELWVAVAFGIFVVATWKPISKAIIGALDTRAERIRKELEQAQRLREEAQGLLAEFQRKQRDALQEADEIIARAKSEAERIQRDARAKLETDLKLRADQAMQRIAQAEQAATQEVRAAAAQIAMLATRQLLDQKLDSGAHTRLIDQAIRELPTKLN